MFRRFAVLFLVTLLVAPTRVPAQGISTDAIKAGEAGQKALEERRFADALSSFNAAAKLAPRIASFAFGAGVSAFMLGQNTEAERLLVRALQLDPGLTDASLVLGELQYRSGRLNEAVATYQAALKFAPGDRRLTDKVAQWASEARAESQYAETRGVHFRVLFEGPVDQELARRAVEILENSYLRVGDQLAFYPTQPVEVVLYTAQQFRDITRGPAWAGGAYDGRIRVPVKGALQESGDLDRVLTHEYVHALIAGLSARGVPAWMNEGLAVALEPGGLDSAQRLLSEARSRPRLDQLHNGFGGMSDTQARIAYAESAVAARALLDVRGPSAVLSLLQDLATGTPFSAAFQQRMGMRYEEFQQSLAQP